MLGAPLQRNLSSSCPKLSQGAQRKKVVKSRSDFLRHPPRPSARRQDLETRVQIIAHPLYSPCLREDRHLCRQSEGKWR
ncbi:hypothetical protein B0T16DRAFT_510985 [Cercophora newfieldiana]|uniref:Uncharacterized protein n=1 Tax=Cercophora newfieldiana TaxID=92897 RepID=A0AA39Y6J3_9PEZI|nr:hypothetical protein B0T16DRAFT_510985 [Cercophora newfieldiana]